MDDNIIQIYIENMTVNDDAYLIQKLCFENGSNVSKGQIIAMIETSKAVADVYAPESGYLYYNKVKEGQEAGVGFLLGIISKNGIVDSGYFDECNYSSNNKIDGTLTKFYENFDVRVSQAAMKLLQEHNLSTSVFKGKKIIRSSDVNDYLNSIIVKRSSKLETSNNKVKLIIIGAGGHAKMCIEIVQQSDTYEIVGLVDSRLEKGTEVYGLTVIGNENDLKALYDNGNKNAVIGFSALHKPIIRQQLYENLLKIGYTVPTIIHKSSIIEPSVVVGDGNQIMAGAIIGSDVKIGNNNILNSGCIVSHDSILYDNVHIAPGAILAGSVTIGSSCIIGMGVTVYMKVRIGNNCIVYNGINVFENQVDGTVLKHKIL